VTFLDNHELRGLVLTAWAKARMHLEVAVAESQSRFMLARFIAFGKRGELVGRSIRRPHPPRDALAQTAQSRPPRGNQLPARGYYTVVYLRF
jgi:hypothetical protein